jgi:putative ABC transport system permease protein
VTVTLFRLAFAGIRSRALASFLTIVLAAGAAATIVLTLEVGATASDPWMRTFDAAHGAHVLGNLASETEARRLASLPGVAERDEPAPVTRVTMEVDGRPTQVLVTGLGRTTRINSPVGTEGDEVSDGGAVVERSLAQSLNIDLGTPLEFVSLGARLELEAAGTAISPAQPRYPRSSPGMVWVTREAFEQIQPDSSQWRWQQAVRLADPALAPAFANEAASRFPPATVSIEPWQSQREAVLLEAQPIQLVLTLYAFLLLFVSVAVVAILTGARVSSQHREIGLLKAIGLTPGQVSVVFVIESLVLGIGGVAIGFIPGALLAPRLAAPAAATLLGSPTVSADPRHIVIAGGAILPVIVVSAFVSARRATRAGALQAIRAGTPVPAPRSHLAGMIWHASWLPIAMALGLKDLLARRMRPLWLILAVGVTSAALVVTLSVQSALGDRPTGEPSDVPGELGALILALDAVLALITLSALLSVALLSVRERIRDFGVLRAVGLTPHQVTLSVAGTHAALAIVASVFSIPAGVGLYLALYAIASGEGGAAATIAPWWWLAIVPIAVCLATVVATAVPACLAARVPTADAVRYE